MICSHTVQRLEQARMLFHTWEFFIFFGIVYAGYLCLRKTPYYLHWLLVASLPSV